MGRAASILALLICFRTLPVAQSKEYAVFDIVGDSISRGVNPQASELYGWADMLFGDSITGIPAKTNTLATLWPGISQNNSAVSGSTASQWSADWNGHLTAVKNRHPDLVVVYIGGNDLLGSIQDGFVSLQDLALYRTNLTSIVTNLQNNSPVPDIILGTYYDPFDGYSANLDGTMSHLTNASPTTRLANQTIAEVAASNGCFLLSNIHGGFLHHGYGEELYAGSPHATPDYMQLPLSAFDIHPVTAGHEKLYERMFEKLLYLKNHAVPESWMAGFALTNYPVDVALDQDADGAPTWQEYVAGTDPTNGQSVFKLRMERTNGQSMVSWDAVSPRVYGIDWSTNLAEGFYTWMTNVVAPPYTDSVHAAEQTIFYRATVEIN